MALNDFAERMRQADEWLANAEIGSEHYKAAMEFLGATDVAHCYERVSLLLLETASFNVTEVVLANLRHKIGQDLFDKGAIPLALPRQEIIEHRSAGDPFQGQAVFHMWVPRRTVAK